MAQRIPRTDGPPVLYPPPLAVEVMRRFPGHWEFRAPWWQDIRCIYLPVGRGHSVGVRWPALHHPDAHSWRVEFNRDGCFYTMRHLGTLDELPGAAAGVIVRYAHRGYSAFTGLQSPERAADRKILLSGQPSWLQVEIDRLTATP